MMGLTESLAGGGTLGVVPVFVNAGAAMAPAIVAGAATVAGALVKPKVLLPLAGVAGVIAAVVLLWPAPQQSHRLPRHQASRPPPARKPTGPRWR